MAIPDFQSIMLPLLEYHGDGKVHSVKETTETLAAQFNLTKEEINELLPSGLAKKFYNRVAWAKNYLTTGKLIKSPKRAYNQITDLGLRVLKDNPDKISTKYLKHLNTIKKQDSDENNSDKKVQIKSELFEQAPGQTPDEIIKDAYSGLRQKLVQEILTEVKNCSPQYFERIVLDLLVSMGYGGSFSDAARLTAQTGDGGIDGVIKEDKLGLDVIYLQAKRWENQVSRPEVQKFAGALMGGKAKKGVFITTSGFSKGAIEYAQSIAEQKIVLIDGELLAEYMIDYNLGVSISETLYIKNVDTDYFIEE